MRLISQMGKLRLSAQETPEELKPLATVPRKRHWPLAATWPGPQGTAQALRPVSLSTSLPPISSPERHPGGLFRGGHCPGVQVASPSPSPAGEAHPCCRLKAAGRSGPAAWARTGGGQPVRWRGPALSVLAAVCSIPGARRQPWAGGCPVGSWREEPRYRATPFWGTQLPGTGPAPWTAARWPPSVRQSGP